MTQSQKERDKKIIQYTLNSSMFKAIFLLLIIISLYGILNREKDSNLFYDFYLIYKNPWMLCCLEVCLLINTINFVQLFHKRYQILIRNNNRAKNLKDMTHYVIILNSIIIFISFLLTSLGLILKNFGDFTLVSINGVNILCLIIFMILKILCFCVLSSIAMLYIQNITNIKCTLCISILITILFIITPIHITTDSHPFSINFVTYLVSYESTNILRDINQSLLMALILISGCLILYNLAKQSRIDLG